MSELIPKDYIESRIFLIRGRKVMFDRDLARLYGVSTKRLNQQVNRNVKRFPHDFMLQLNPDEIASLSIHSVAMRRGQNTKYPPRAFTEQGISMLSSVLRSERAILVNIAIVRTFVRLREILLSHADLARKLAELEKKYDAQFKNIFDALREVMEPEKEPPRRIGFRAEPG